MSSKTEFIDGYKILLAALIGISIGITSLYFYTFGLFIKPLQQEFAWSRTAISSVSLLGGLTLTFSSPFIGSLVDKLGARKVAITSLIGFAVGFYLLSFTTANFMVFLFFIFLIHLLGAGTTPVVYSKLVNQWFNQARGLALGLSLAGTGLTGAFAPYLLAEFMQAYGWRNSYRLLAVMIILITPLVYVLLKTRLPKNLTNKDEPKGIVTSKQPLHSDVLGLSFKEARQGRVFWLLLLLFFSVATAIGGIVVHFVPLLSDAGMQVSQAAAIAGILGVSVIIGRVCTGLLFDRFFAPRIAQVIFIIATAGVLSLAIDGVNSVWFSAFALGLSLGAEVDMISYFVARYFGLRAYGKIYGFQYAMFMLGMSFSPIVVGLIYDNLGGYYYALLLSACMLIVALISTLFLPRFPHFYTTEKG